MKKIVSIIESFYLGRAIMLFILLIIAPIYVIYLTVKNNTILRLWIKEVGLAIKKQLKMLFFIHLIVIMSLLIIGERLTWALVAMAIPISALFIFSKIETNNADKPKPTS